MVIYFCENVLKIVMILRTGLENCFLS